MSRPLNPWKLSGYKAGQNVVCRITNAEPGGYAVLIPKDNLPGFLPTQARLKLGDEILAQFVCVHNNRILLSARFQHTAAVTENTVTPSQSVKWEEQLRDDQFQTPADAYQTVDDSYQANEGYQQANNNQQTEGYEAPTPAKPYSYNTENKTPRQPPPQIQPQAPAKPPMDAYQAAMMGDEEPEVQQEPPGQSEPELAFATWAQTTPRKFHLKRAIDLILPPIQQETLNTFKIADYDVEWLITDLEGGMRTGCVKAMCESRLSRSALLLYRGRAVGCIYGCKSMPETQPTEQSLQLMLHDLTVPDTNVTLYDLPESVTLAMSALFLGYPVQRNDDYDARSYMDYICSWFESKGQTACLAITLNTNPATCLGFIYKGQFVGAFYVEDQTYTPDKNFVYELLRNDPKANVEASILPPEMTSSAVRFGFSLSMARNKRSG